MYCYCNFSIGLKIFKIKLKNYITLLLKTLYVSYFIQSKSHQALHSRRCHLWGLVSHHSPTPAPLDLFLPRVYASTSGLCVAAPSSRGALPPINSPSHQRGFLSAIFIKEHPPATTLYAPYPSHFVHSTSHSLTRYVFTCLSPAPHHAT